MGALSAINSLVSTGSAIACTSKWSLTSKADIKTQVCSVTRGGTARVVGNEDWSGSWEAFGHTPPVKPGEAFTGSFVISGEPGTQIGFTGDAIVDSVRIVISPETGNPERYTVNFSGNGLLSVSGTLNVALPTAIAVAYPSKGTKVQTGTVAASPSFSELVDIREVTLELRCDNKSYVSSSSAGATLRVKGNFDWTMDVSLYSSTWTGLPARNAVNQWRAFVDATTYWDLKWGIVTDYTNIEADRESGALVGCTVRVAMQAATPVSGTPTGGFVNDPAAVAWFTGT